MTIFTPTEQAAITRLASDYNGLPYDALTNPSGLAVGGHRINEIPMMQDAAAVATALARVIAAAANYVGRYAYTYLTNAAATDPTSGYLKFNNATLASATVLYISEVTADALSISGDIATWDDSTSAIRGFIKMYDQADITTFALFAVTGGVVDNGAWDTLTVSYVTGNGSFVNNDSVSIQFQRNGDKGDTGASGPAFSISSLTTLSATIDESADYEAIYSNSEAATRKVLASVRNARINRVRRAFNATMFI